MLSKLSPASSFARISSASLRCRSTGAGAAGSKATVGAFVSLVEAVAVVFVVAASAAFVTVVACETVVVEAAAATSRFVVVTVVSKLVCDNWLVEDGGVCSATLVTGMGSPRLMKIMRSLICHRLCTGRDFHRNTSPFYRETPQWSAASCGRAWPG